MLLYLKMSRVNVGYTGSQKEAPFLSMAPFVYVCLLVALAARVVNTKLGNDQPQLGRVFGVPTTAHTHTHGPYFDYF